MTMTFRPADADVAEEFEADDADVALSLPADYAEPAFEADEAPADPATLRQQASMILTAMDAAAVGRGKPPGRYERRDAMTRLNLKQEATLRLFAESGRTQGRPIFIRDVEPRAAGFVSPSRLPLGYGGTLECRDLNGEPRTLGVTIIRCRSCYGGWFEGAAYFHQVQKDFGPCVEERI